MANICEKAKINNGRKLVILLLLYVLQINVCQGADPFRLSFISSLRTRTFLNEHISRDKLRSTKKKAERHKPRVHKPLALKGLLHYFKLSIIIHIN